MKNRALVLLFAATLALAPPFLAPSALGQIGGLVLPDVSGPVGEIVGDAAGAAETLAEAPLAQTLRRAQVRELLAAYRDVLEADPQGEIIVRGQILAISPAPGVIERLRAEGYDILRSDELDGVGALVALRAPPGVSTRRALRRLRAADPGGTYDFDHVHLPSGAAEPAAAAPLAPSGAVGDGPRIGLIDGGVGAHPSLRGVIAAQRCFVGSTPVAHPHATAIASLIAGRGGPLRSAAPGARLWAADIYGGAPTGGSSAALARALLWLAGEATPVINVSLVGPRNRIVEAVIARLVARGFLVVAAVGNDGPAAAPLFPAAYPGVVGITGVDARGRVLREAGRGPQVDFAAPGAAIAAASIDDPNGYVDVRGTSYAAPLAAGLLAGQARAPNPQAAAQALNHLRARARDLGAPGRDDIYGYGLVAAELTLSHAR